MMREIVRRKRVGKATLRVLECGHEQNEHSGGEASIATRAYCRTCTPGDHGPGIERPVIGTCTAISFRVTAGNAAVCGEPAKHLKRGQPRCTKHYLKGCRD